VNVALLFSQLLNGLATGMLYALMGIGLSIITGVLNIPNFAHGALFALGAYFLYAVIQPNLEAAVLGIKTSAEIMQAAEAKVNELLSK